MDSVSLRCSPLSSQDCHKPRCLPCRVKPLHRHLFCCFEHQVQEYLYTQIRAVYNREYTTHKGDNTGLPPSSGIFIISHHILKPICYHSFNILLEYHPNTGIILTFVPYDTRFLHYRQIFSPFLKSPTWLPTKSPTFIVGNQLPIKR